MTLRGEALPRITLREMIYSSCAQSSALPEAFPRQLPTQCPGTVGAPPSLPLGAQQAMTASNDWTLFFPFLMCR